MRTSPSNVKTPGAKLQAHLKSNAIPQEAFAARIGIGQASLSKICRNLIKPSLATASAIERETNGEFPASSWVSPSKPKAARTVKPASCATVQLADRAATPSKRGGA